ncbi:MAG: CBS domain-containing protein [Myxococcota bacterium]
MTEARDMMEPAVVVTPDLDLKELAARLLAADVDGVCVVDEGGSLVGVVTGMDLVFREKRVHTPSTFALLDLVVQIGARRTVRELEKIGATKVDELMTTQVVTAAPNTPLEQLATMMVDQHLSMIPIVEHGRPVGVVTRRGMVAASLRHLVGDDRA